MKPQPLKGKGGIIIHKLVEHSNRDWFQKEDIRSAVKWFMEEFVKETDGLDDLHVDTWKVIKKAFEDVMG